ncbi:MAG: DUF2953 domain-containing protein [Halanaerobiales bacterium]
MLLILLISFILLSVYIYYLPLKLKIEYRRQDKDGEFTLKIFLILRIILFRIRLPLFTAKIQNLIRGFFDKFDRKMLELFRERIENKTNKKRIPEFIDIDIFIKKGIWKRLKPVKGRLNWMTKYGFRDPALTGVIYGMLWSAKTNVVTILKEFDLIQSAGVEIIPDFNTEHLHIYFCGIFDFYLGNIIYTGLLLFKEVVISGRINRKINGYSNE